MKWGRRFSWKSLRTPQQLLIIRFPFIFDWRSYVSRYEVSIFVLIFFFMINCIQIICCNLIYWVKGTNFREYDEERLWAVSVFNCGHVLKSKLVLLSVPDRISFEQTSAGWGAWRSRSIWFYILHFVFLSFIRRIFPIAFLCKTGKTLESTWQCIWWKEGSKQKKGQMGVSSIARGLLEDMNNSSREQW